MHRILELLEKNSTLTVSDLAVMLDKSEEEIQERRNYHRQQAPCGLAENLQRICHGVH